MNLWKKLWNTSQQPKMPEKQPKLTKEEEKQFKKELRQVFSSLVLLASFAYPLLSMPIKICYELNSYAAVDGVNFCVNPIIWKKLAAKQRLFVSMHEWLHVALRHYKTIRQRKSRTHNYAADFVINGMILEDMKDRFEAPCLLYDPIYTGLVKT